MFIINHATDKFTTGITNTTVIEGTNRLQDLIPAFLTTLRYTPEYEQLTGGVFPAVPAYAQEDDDSEWWTSEDAVLLLQDLTATLETYAPESTYFGAHPGNGSDYGFWTSEEEGD